MQVAGRASTSGAWSRGTESPSARRVSSGSRGSVPGANGSLSRRGCASGATEAWTGNRENPVRATAASTAPTVGFGGRAVTRSSGTITSATVFSADDSVRLSRWVWAASSSPSRRDSETHVGDLGRGVRRLLLVDRHHPEQAQDVVGDPVEDPDDRLGDLEEGHQRRDQPQRRALGPGDGDVLRHHLADDDVQDRRRSPAPPRTRSGG